MQSRISTVARLPKHSGRVARGQMGCGVRPRILRFNVAVQVVRGCARCKRPSPVCRLVLIVEKPAAVSSVPAFFPHNIYGQELTSSLTIFPKDNVSFYLSFRPSLYPFDITVCLLYYDL